MLARVWRCNVRLWLQRIGSVCVIILFALVGAYYLHGSHAATTTASSEADLGTVTGSALVQADTSASGGKAVRFANTPTIQIRNGVFTNANGKTVRLLGSNVSGTETACIQNKGLSWIPSGTSLASVAAGMKTWRINTVRVEMNEDCWLGINGAPAAYSGVTYRKYIKSWVTALNDAGIITVLDLHWAAPGTYQPKQQWAMANTDHSLTFWTQVATAYKNNPAVLYDLFNEPSMGGVSPTTADWQCWLNGCSKTYDMILAGDTTATTVTYQTAGMQQLVNTVRATGSTQPILVGGLNWAGDPCGTHNSGGNGGVCTQTSMMPTDPANQLAISFHTYNWTSCRTTACWDAMAAGANAAKLPIVTGEFGEDDCAANYITSYMNWADRNNVSYLTWSYNLTLGTTGSCTTQLDSLQLLSNWDGTPSLVSPAAPVYKAHLLQVAP